MPKRCRTPQESSSAALQSWTACTRSTGRATKASMDVVALSGEPAGVYWYSPTQLLECLKALNGTLMLEVVQHSALLLKTDELVCFQMAVREPKTIESKPQKTKKPRKEAA